MFSKRRIKRLYLLNLWMDVVHTFPNVKYWSETLCFVIPIHMSDLEIKVIYKGPGHGLKKKNMLKFFDEGAKCRSSIQVSYAFPATALIYCSGALWPLEAISFCNHTKLC